MFFFQAKLVPIPEGYKPKEWEYYKNPISRCAHNAYIADNVSFCLAKQTDQADGEILETFRRSARVRDEHAWSLGSSQGKPTILYFIICPQVFSLPFHYITLSLQMCPIFCAFFSLCSTDCRDAFPEEGGSQTNADSW